MKQVFISITFFLFYSLSDGALSQEEQKEEWEMFKLQYGKNYVNDEEQNLRKSIWKNTVDFINIHNQQADMGKYSYRLGMNKYGDWTSDEINSYLNGGRYTHSNTEKGATFLTPNNIRLPKEIDWRTKGYVTPVKDQKRCGSCWAFSAIAGLEGQHFRKTKKLVSLSEQNLIDCSKENAGCNGGYPNKAYDYIKENHGIDTEASYPYAGNQSKTCGFLKDKVGATCTGYVKIALGNETSLQVAVASVGPISACIDASQRTFHMYKSGVYDEPHCTTMILDHCILIAGYGVSNGKDYWLVKNSWGTDWGMNGYIMMSRNKDNQCGIASRAVYPTV